MDLSSIGLTNSDVKKGNFVMDDVVYSEPKKQDLTDNELALHVVALLVWQNHGLS